MFTNLIELIKSMPDEKTCREYIAVQRWGKDRVVCPYCQHEKAYLIEGGKRYKCASKACYKKFSVTIGTIMEASNIPLVKWLTGIYLVSSHKKGISSYQLGRDLGIAQKNAWHMIHRIREMLRVKENVKLDNIVEIDEVYMGGKVGNMSKTKRKKLRDEGNTYNTKTMVIGMIERGGNLKLIPIGSSNNMSALQPLIRQNVDKDAVLITDSLGSYTGLNKDFAGHEVVNHTEHEYVRDEVFHTNSIEGAFSMLRRSIYGIYHQVTPKHLDRYCDETMFRYNFRKMTDANRFAYSLTNIEGRLTWNELVQENGTPINPMLQKNIPDFNSKGKHRAIVQIKDGVVIGQFKSVAEAKRQTGINGAMIRRVLLGKRTSVHGYQWKYL
jgi:transposase-like protein